MEGSITRCLFGDEIQEIPLRHERDELAPRREVRELADRYRYAADGSGQLRELLMRALQKLIEHSEFMHDFQRGGMDSIATEIPEEIGVLFEDEHFHSGTRQQESQHQSGGAAARDAAAHLSRFRYGLWQGHADQIGRAHV